jgi:amidase
MRILLPLALALATPAIAAPPIVERPLADLSADLAAGRATSAALTRAYIKRIVAMDRKGPTLRAVIAINPDALAMARASDARRKAGQSLGPLDGVPILVKDNIETRDPMATTAGSLAMKDNITLRDAPVIARLRAAGAVILGKTNLSEWANIRSNASMSGWSAVGGLVRNPYALDRTACGSSSGTGAAVAASFAAAGLGTETSGSVICPSAINGLVGLKPTVGLVSRTWIVPISSTQDTAGPMARSVRDAAILFGAMVGSDPEDRTTVDADHRRMDYAAGLSADALKGRRVAVLRPEMSADLTAVFDTAVARLTAAGAVVVPVKRPPVDIGSAGLTVLLAELKAGLNAYLASTPPMVKTRSLAEVIAFDRANAATEMPFFGQELFEQAEAGPTTAEPAYRAALAKTTQNSAAALETMLKAADADILVAPSTGAAWLSDPVHGDQTDGPSAAGLPAMAGWPHLTVPMGQVDGLPVGLSFITRKYGEATLFATGYAFEQQGGGRKPPTYAEHATPGSGLDGVR